MKQGIKCMSSFKYLTDSIEGLNFCALLSSLYAIATAKPNPAFLSSQISPGSQWEFFRCIAMDYKAESFLRNRAPTIFKLETSHHKSDLCALSQPEAVKENLHLYLSSNTDWNKHCIPIKENTLKKKKSLNMKHFRLFASSFQWGTVILLNTVRWLSHIVASGISLGEKHSSLIFLPLFWPCHSQF